MNHSLTVFFSVRRSFFCFVFVIFFFLVEKNIIKQTKNKNGKKFQLEVLLEHELELELEVSGFPEGIGERKKRTPAMGKKASVGSYDFYLVSYIIPFVQLF